MPIGGGTNARNWCNMNALALKTAPCKTQHVADVLGVYHGCGTPSNSMHIECHQRGCAQFEKLHGVETCAHHTPPERGIVSRKPCRQRSLWETAWFHRAEETPNCHAHGAAKGCCGGNTARHRDCPSAQPREPQLARWAFSSSFCDATSNKSMMQDAFWDLEDQKSLEVASHIQSRSLQIKEIHSKSSLSTPQAEEFAVAYKAPKCRKRCMRRRVEGSGSPVALRTSSSVKWASCAWWISLL